jgi:hypothetical protein
VVEGLGGGVHSSALKALAKDAGRATPFNHPSSRPPCD